MLQGHVHLSLSHPSAQHSQSQPPLRRRTRCTLFRYLSVPARLYLTRSQRLIRPLPCISVQSVTPKHMLINNALSFWASGLSISCCKAFIFYSDYHWEQVLPVFSYPAFAGTMVVKVLGVSRTTRYVWHELCFSHRPYIC